jgi:hypothetical protein
MTAPAQRHARFTAKRPTSERRHFHAGSKFGTPLEAGWPCPRAEPCRTRFLTGWS